MLAANLSRLSSVTMITNDEGTTNNINGIFACDLLSHVMGFAKEGDVLLTVLNNINVLGVASLLDLSCVIFTYGIEVSSTIIDKANELGIPLFRTKLSTANVVLELQQLGITN